MEDKENKSIKDTLKQLNTYSFQPRRKLLLHNMKINKKYHILLAQKTMKMNKSKKTVIKLEIDEYYIYLPKRFDKVPNHIWNNLNNNNFEICNTGRKKGAWNLIFSSSKETVFKASDQFNITEYLNDFSYKPSFYTDNE